MKKQSNSKKKLLVFHPALAPYRVDFFNALDCSFDAAFYFFNVNLLNQKFNQNNLKKQINFKCNYLKKGFNLSGRSFRFGVIAAIKKEKPDLILLPEYNLLNITVILYRIFFNQKLKIYSICDDNVAIASKSSSLRKLLRSFHLKHLNGVILTHNAVADWYKANLTPDCQLLVFPIIRKENRFRKQLNASVPIAREYISKYKLRSKKTFLFVGRLVEVKNLNRLIKAFKIVSDKNEDAVLVIVGSGELEYQLKKLVSSLDLNEYVLFPGRFEEEELLAWYLISGVFILPSISETFGAVINEALLSGNYVMASRLTGGSALLNENVNGNTFNPYNLSEISDLILQCIDNTKLFDNQGLVRSSNMLIDFESYFNRFRLQLSEE